MPSDLPNEIFVVDGISVVETSSAIRQPSTLPDTTDTTDVTPYGSLSATQVLLSSRLKPHGKLSSHCHADSWKSSQASSGMTSGTTTYPSLSSAVSQAGLVMMQSRLRVRERQQSNSWISGSVNISQMTACSPHL